MDYLTWYYSYGIYIFINRFTLSLKRVIHFFALPVLLKSLFSPWKRMQITGSTGFNLAKAFENLSFNMISRSIGSIVRSTLIIICIFVLMFQLVARSIILLLQLLIPIFGFSEYKRERDSHKNTILKIAQEMIAHPKTASTYIFSCPAGQYLLSHLGIDLAAHLSLLQVDPTKLLGFSPKSFEEIITWLIKENPEFEQKLHTLSVSPEEVALSAKCWDIYKQSKSLESTTSSAFGSVGIGKELITGYTPNLDNYVNTIRVDDKNTSYLVGRRDIVNVMDRILSSDKCVLLVGEPGVGKKSAVYEFAHRAGRGELSQELSYDRILEFDYQAILAQSSDQNTKKVLLTQLLEEASFAGDIILVIQDLHRLTTADASEVDFGDVISTILGKGNLRIVAISNTSDYEKYISHDSQVSKYFEKVDVLAPTKEEAMTILINYSQQIESTREVIITASALISILEGSDKYISDIPFPEKSLELLHEVITSSRDNKIITAEKVNQILSEKTGISVGNLTKQGETKLVNLEAIIHKSLIGQDGAISQVAQSLRARTMSLKDGSRPVGSFLFLGPTGVGKTQTAKVLAEVYYGSQENILRFDMAEYVGPEGVTRLIGSITSNQPGTLTTAIKNHPASLLLLDEIEKCPPEIFNLLLTILDEGYITDAIGKKINCQNLFVIATSNAGSQFIRDTVASGVKGEKLQSLVLAHIQSKGYFSPELLNRFDGVVVFEPLNLIEMSKVTVLELDELKKNLLAKNIYLEYGPDLVLKIAKDGYDPASGARPIRHIIDLTLSDLLGKSILEHKIVEGDKVKLIPGGQKNEYKLEKI